MLRENLPRGIDVGLRQKSLKLSVFLDGIKTQLAGFQSGEQVEAYQAKLR